MGVGIRFDTTWYTNRPLHGIFFSVKLYTIELSFMLQCGIFFSTVTHTKGKTMNKTPVVISNGDFHIENTSQRFENNPFIEFMEIRTSNKVILGRSEAVTTNSRTGEIMGHQLVATFKKVDAEQFVKIFADKISTIFNLSKTGYKMLMIIINVMQERTISKDLFYMSFRDAEVTAQAKNNTLSRVTFKKGVAELISNGIIARAASVNTYYINPAIIYNGNRTKLTFVEQYQMASAEELAQPDLLED